MTTANNTATATKLTPEEEAQLFMSLLNTDMDDIDRVSMGFVTLPDGTYTFANVQCKIVPERLRISLMAEVESVVEVAPGVDQADADKCVGERYAESFNKAFGVQRFRTLFEEVMLTLGVREPSALVQALNGTRLLVTIGHRKDKNDASKVYNEIRAVMLAP